MCVCVCIYITSIIILSWPITAFILLPLDDGIFSANNRLQSLERLNSRPPHSHAGEAQLLIRSTTQPRSYWYINSPKPSPSPSNPAQLSLLRRLSITALQTRFFLQFLTIPPDHLNHFPSISTFTCSCYCNSTFPSINSPSWQPVLRQLIRNQLLHCSTLPVSEQKQGLYLIWVIQTLVHDDYLIQLTLPHSTIHCLQLVPQATLARPAA